MKILSILQFSIFAFLLFCNSEIAAQHTIGGKTCVGTWKTIDDETKKPRSYVKIWEENGKYHGKIIKLLNLEPGESENPICTVCPGDRKNAKVIGMTILSHMKKESNRYAQGKILDPKKGKEYGCTMWLTDKNTLKVRGWYGPIYRTQTWHRIN